MEENKQYIKMTCTPIPKIVMSLAVPTIVSMLVTAIYNMADTFFVSHLGTDASAAVGIVFSIQSMMQAAGFGIGVGAGSLISRLLGKGDDKKASMYASSAFAAAFFFGFLLLLLALFAIDKVMLLFGADAKTTLPYAKDYGFWILMGAPLMCCSFVLNNILRAEGKARFAMVGLTCGGILNILLDPIFIFDKWIGWGTKGAAIATVLSQAISFFILVSFFFMKRTETTLSVKNVSRKFSDYVMIIKTGIPTVCRQGLASVATTMLNWRAKVYGSAAVAAITIANKIYMFIRNAIIGIGQGFQPVAGYNYGAKKYDRVKQAFWFSTLVGSIVVISATVLLAIFAKDIIALFRDDDMEVIRIGKNALYCLCFSLPLMAYSTYVNQVLQCLGKVKRATFLASCRNGILYIPLVLTLPGMNAVYLTQPLADILTCIVSVPFHILFFRELDREKDEYMKKEAFSDE